jgi:hypothetical protein
MQDGHQGEFLFVDGWTPPAGSDGAIPSLDNEIAAVWHVPLGHRVRVVLRDHDMPSAEGLLEAAAAPEFPFNSHRLLHLRIRHVEFTNRQIECLVLF